MGAAAGRAPAPWHPLRTALVVRSAASAVVDQTGEVELGVFDQVDDGLRALVPADLGTLRTQARRWGVKAWFDEEACPRAHYEAQVLSAKHVPGAELLAIEVGFHAEHPSERDNEAALAAIRGAEPTWRDALGPDAVVGPFLGRAGWLRLSETWPDPDLGDPELCFEVADRLAAYVTTLEPLRRRAPAAQEDPAGRSTGRPSRR